MLVGRLVRLRRAEPVDRIRLEAILSEPSVARWWNPPGIDGAAADWLADVGQVTFVIERVGVVVGSIQFDEVTDADYRCAAIDLFLTTDAQGQGLGTDAIRAVARHLFEEREHHRLTIDPAAANERAIRAYRKVGFHPVGIMREYERGADGAWHHNLLMDLLAGELT
ncbi:MAG: GNAT family N-acetyltransferase [Candidatus Limnocylindrales bacterium]